MIPWRTSRFIGLSLLLIAVVTGIAVASMVDGDRVIVWRDYLLARVPFVNQETTPSPVPSPTPLLGPGVAVDVPRYPPVQILRPAVSIFDPAS